MKNLQLTNAQWRIMDKIRMAEHAIRGIQEKFPKAKIGKICRRLVKHLPDGEIQALAQSWAEGEFGIEISKDISVWVAAYAECRSCMQGKGALGWEAYQKVGAALCILRENGRIVARALVSAEGKIFSVYGIAHFNMKAIFKAFAPDAVSDASVFAQDVNKIFVPGKAGKIVFHKKIERESWRSIVALPNTEPVPYVFPYVERATGVYWKPTSQYVPHAPGSIVNGVTAPAGHRLYSVIYVADIEKVQVIREDDIAPWTPFVD